VHVHFAINHYGVGEMEKTGCLVDQRKTNRYEDVDAAGEKGI